MTAGTGSVSGACAYWGLDQNVDDGAWHRVEIDLNAVRDAVLAGASIVSVNGLIVEGADVLVDDLTLAAGRLRRAYQLVPGAALGGTLAVQTGAGGGEGLTAAHARAYYQYNDLGTVLATTDANGARVGLWRPTFFGEYDDTIDYAQGPTASAGSPTWPEIGLTGKIWDEDTKLYYSRFRWYDPHRGRWNNEDPIRLSGGINLYEYVSGFASQRVDTLGLWEEEYFCQCRKAGRKTKPFWKTMGYSSPNACYADNSLPRELSVFSGMGLGMGGYIVAGAGAAANVAMGGFLAGMTGAIDYVASGVKCNMDMCEGGDPFEQNAEKYWQSCNNYCKGKKYPTGAEYSSCMEKCQSNLRRVNRCYHPSDNLRGPGGI